MAKKPGANWLFLLLPILGALVLLTAACGGDDDDGGEEGSATPTTEETEDAGGEEPTTSPDDGEVGDPEDALAQLRGAANQFDTATGVVTYEITSTDDASGGTWTIASNGESTRVDIASDGSTIISITTPEASYLCTELEAGEGSCFTGDAAGIGGLALGLFTQYASSEAMFGYLDAFTGVDVETASEEIAGVEATCYSASGDFGAETGSVKWCFRENGLLLLSQYDFDTASFEMRATEFSEDVPDSAFEPPYEIADFPGLGTDFPGSGQG